MLTGGWELSAFTPAELAERWPTCADESDPTRVPARMMEMWAEAGAWAASEEGQDAADSGEETEQEAGASDNVDREAERWARRAELTTQPFRQKRCAKRSRL